MKSRVHRQFAERMVRMHPRAKIAIVTAVDVLLLAALAAAIGLLHAQDPRALSVFSVIAPFITVAALAAVGAYRAITRFISAEHFLRILAGTAIGGLIAAALLGLAPLPPLHWDAALLYITGGGTLLLVSRGLAAFVLRPAHQPFRSSNRAVIYGAGTAGAQLAAALQVSGRFRPIAFVDDRPEIQGRSLLGLSILSPAKLAELKAKEKFDRILLAIPSLRGARKRQLLESLSQLATKVLVMPSLESLASGSKGIDELHEVEVQDLLSRESVTPNAYLLERNIRHRTVMVTGAAGSIGAELCRQAVASGAHRLILLDHSEYGLYTIHQDLARNALTSGCELVLVLGSVTDEGLMRRVLKEHRVDSVYHAAAYKHVPLVEQNELAAVSNNVFGTLVAARAAVECEVENFVLVSTDKAVRPTSVMGATKRVCELIVQALAVGQERTCMSIVRFGNVLASSGSVIPLFQKQIREGGPVTVTHPDVTRYFMTIGEAAQLVIQAGAMGENGEVFVLDMGEPIRILDLAERMIRLSGLEVRSSAQPAGDIAIEIVGLRPGEKLHEELMLGRSPQTTAHPRILRAAEGFLRWEQLDARLNTIRVAVGNGNRDYVLRALHELAAETWEASAKNGATAPAFERGGTTLQLVADRLS